IDLLAHHPVDWVALGNAHAGRIMAGQWWRTITALTLHADWPHLLSNIAIGGFFIHRLCRELGSGLSWSLVVAAGSLGNLVNAWLHSPSHRAVGASTAVFGALGLLAALNLIRYRHSLRRRWLLPVAAALALLAMLGTEGERTDVGAHLFGFAAGLLLGVATALVTARRGLPRRLLNGLLATATAAMVLGGWLAALTAG
ncbi:MAG: rhomboid family intramembrane serine protease, partial [Desulfuromonadales bacterium]|nr:rhomboid family intramembrane serine protease [Desulfuromonadales bacterium]